MKFALFRCCVTSVYLKQYESSTDAVLGKLGVELIDVPEFNCCGYPLKNYDFKAYVLSSARNLCLAEKQNLNIMTLCNCCYGSLKHADHLLREDLSIRKEINAILQKEGLNYDGSIEIRHLLDIFHKDIGIEHIRQSLVKTFNGPKIATHYGCHILRPRQIVQFDDPEEPSIFDTLVEVTGAESVDWKDKVKCCGAPVWGVNDELSMDLTKKKITDARQSGAEYLCVSCAYCQLQFDRVQRLFSENRKDTDYLPSILYTQLLGLCLGVDAESLGIHQNELSISGIMDCLS
jgi:heterodisulfide reductase subunit B